MSKRMSSKIEVSRGMLKHLERCAESMGWSIADELRALLAAPVVERQPFAYSFRFAGCVTSAGPENWRDEIDREKPAQFLFDDGRVKDFQPLYAAPPELAELQATIATLKILLGQARGMVNGASDEWHNSVEKVIGHE
jgi:hypothetical protein